MRAPARIRRVPFFVAVLLTTGGHRGPQGKSKSWERNPSRSEVYLLFCFVFISLPDVLEGFGEGLLTDGAVDVAGVAGKHKLEVVSLVG